MKNIKFVVGDLIAAAEDGRVTDLMHGCNCGIQMGGGFALFLKRKRPEVFVADQQFGMKDDRNKLGLYSQCRVVDTSRQMCYNVFNLYTQLDVGNDRFYYFAFEKAFRGAVKQVIEHGAKYNYVPTVGIPLIGAVRGGGDWNQIYHQIVSVVLDLDPEGKLFKLDIYLMESDQQAWDIAFPHGQEYVTVNAAGDELSIIQHVDPMFGRDVYVGDPKGASRYLPRYQGVVN